jgi:hypothetical protein
MADRSIFNLTLAGLNRAHHHIADVGADAGLEIYPFFCAQSLCEAVHLLLHSQSRVEGALWMVFVSNRRTEQCEDAIPGRLHDEAAVAVYSLHHQLERGIDNGTRLFRVEVLHQLHRTLDVGEQCGNHLALTVRSA